MNESTKQQVNESTTREVAEALVGIARDSGHDPGPDSAILDLGCGTGELVREFRAMGLQAYGADVDADALSRADPDLCRLIPGDAYRLPFPGETFDFVFSNQVFEHVTNFPETLQEIRRVLKPGALSVHIFPAKYRPIECHLFVPLAGVVQNLPYLWFWALLGIRNEYQQELGPMRTARQNRQFLRTRTNYLSKRAIARRVRSVFANARFVEDLYLKQRQCMAGRKWLYAVFRSLPLAAKLFSALRSRVVAFRKDPSN